MVFQGDGRGVDAEKEHLYDDEMYKWDDRDWNDETEKEIIMMMCKVVCT